MLWQGMITDYEQHCTCAILKQLLLIIVSFCQVLKEREEAAFVLTDDFLENGNEQVLLLPPNLTISDSKGFLCMIKWCDIS